MAKRFLNKNVYDEALSRCREMYESGNLVVVAFSGGKDSGICLELCKIAAEETGNLPVQAIMRDEEIMFPGTYEYAERVYNDPMVDLDWVYGIQNVTNAFSRENPLWFTFDPALEPDEWVRTPPKFAEFMPERYLTKMVNMEKYTPEPGKYVYNVLGLRAQESLNRRMAMYSSRGWYTKPEHGVIKARPIYDWKETDVWKAIHDFKWDYNYAYTVMYRMGLKRQYMRIAPPTLSAASIESLGMAQRAWPQWFDKVAKRIPGIRTAAQYGRRVVEPQRRYKETWKQCFERVCLTDAPQWIKDRSQKAMENTLRTHAKHSTTPFPDVNPCQRCSTAKSWRELAKIMYMGDPFSIKMKSMAGIQPTMFRPDADNLEPRFDY